MENNFGYPIIKNKRIAFGLEQNQKDFLYLIFVTLQKVIKLNSVCCDQVLQKTKIVELIGPPGIGKSTIYKALCVTRNRNAAWTTQHLLFQKGKPEITNTKKWMEYQLRSFFKRNERQSLSPDHGLLFMEEHKELANVLWKHLSDRDLYSDEETGLRFRASFFLFKDFCRYQQIWTNSSSCPCIIEEGFLQKSFLVSHNYLFDERKMREYLSLLPRPHAIIYVNTHDNSIILDRLQNRNKVIASHKGKSYQALQSDIENWQRVFETMLRHVKQDYNIPVFHINGANSIHENVNRINQIMNDISDAIDGC